MTDACGRSVGHLRDLVSRQRGCRFELIGLECGKVSLGDRLGYRPDTMGGLWPLTALFRWLNRHSLFVEWTAVRDIRPEWIEISTTKEQLDRFIDVAP